jgi:hypothetical protein
MEQKSSWEANVSSSSQEINQIYETRMFINAFSTTRLLSLS